MRDLHTSRLLIRAFQPADLDDFAALMRSCFDSSADTPSFQNQLSFYALGNDVLEHLRQPPYGDRAIVLNLTGQLIGSVGFVPRLAPFAQLPSLGNQTSAPFTPEVGLFWAIAPEHRRNGYAAEATSAMIRFAFDELHLARIVATTERDNVASIAVMRRLGMTIEPNPQPTPHWFQIVGILSATSP